MSLHARGSVPLLDSRRPQTIVCDRGKVRERYLELYPDREDLYDMIYESRFKRLWDQFRDEDQET
jgi:hypothetical protein